MSIFFVEVRGLWAISVSWYIIKCQCFMKCKIRETLVFNDVSKHRDNS